MHSTGPQSAVVVQGIRIDVLTTDTLFGRVMELVVEKQRRLVTYVNVHTMNVAWRSRGLRTAYRHATLTYCDGGGVVVGARILGKFLPQRMTGATFIDDYCNRWKDTSVSLFFLGGKPGIAQEACRRLENRYPGLTVAGCHHGYFLGDPQAERKVLDKVNRAAPDILFVGFGTPLQEEWVLDVWERLPQCVVWPVGAVVDYVSGSVSRCPRWMQKGYLEWLYRLLLEPRRMFKRYVVGNVLFMVRILGERVFGSSFLPAWSKEYAKR